MGGGSSTDTIEYIGGVTLVGPKSQSIHVPLTSEDLESGDLNQGVFKKTFSISPDAEPGTWRLADYYLNDKAGNYSSLADVLRIQSNDYNNDNEITRNLKTELLRSILEMQTTYNGDH